MQSLSGLNYDRNFQTPPLPAGTAILTDRSGGSVAVDVGVQGQVSLPPSYAFGDPARGQWSPLDDEAPINRGDVLRMKYKLRVPFLESWQSGALLTKLQADPRFKIRYFALNEEISTLTVEAEVIGVFKNNPAPVVAILVAGAIAAIAIGIGVWLAVGSVEKLGVLDFSDIAAGKINVTAILVGGVLLIFVLAALGKAGLVGK